MGLLITMGKGQGYLKAGFLGFPKSGKTYTATLLAIATREHFKLKGPIGFFDTEGGAEYVAPLIKLATGMDPVGVRSRSFDDLVTTAEECVKEGISVMIADSMTHVWRELCDAHLKDVNDARKRKNLPARHKLEFQDWGIIKGTWAKWTDLYLNSKLHIVIAGRAGFDYDYDENEETGRKELIKTGIKMKTEGEFGFEPSLLIEMEQVQNLPQGGRSRGKPRPGLSVSRRAVVIGDRFSVIDGAEATFTTASGANKLKTELGAVTKFFGAHLAMLTSGAHAPIDTEIKSSTGVDETGDAQFYRDRRDRTILCEEIQGAILKLYSGQTAAEKKAKADLLEEVFHTRSWTKVETLIALPDLRAGLETIRTMSGTSGSPKLERITELAMELAQAGLSTEQIVDLYERGGGVIEPQHLQEGDIAKVITLMEEELEAVVAKRGVTKKGNGKNGRSKEPTAPVEPVGSAAPTSASVSAEGKGLFGQGGVQ
jgi:hypothetical protein